MRTRNLTGILVLFLILLPAFALAQGDDWTFNAPPLNDQSAERLRSAFISIVPN